MLTFFATHEQKVITYLSWAKPLTFFACLGLAFTIPNLGWLFYVGFILSYSLNILKMSLYMSQRSLWGILDVGGLSVFTLLLFMRLSSDDQDGRLGFPKNGGVLIAILIALAVAFLVCGILYALAQVLLVEVLAKRAIERQEFEKAIQHLNWSEKFAIAEHLPQIQLNRAQVWGIHLHNWSKCLQDVQKALRFEKLKPNDRNQAHLLQGHAYLAGRAFAKAIESYSAIDLEVAEPNVCCNVYLNRGEILGQMGQFGQALSQLDYALEIAPTDRLKAHVIDSRGLVYFLMGDYARALAEYERATQTDENHFYPWAGQAVANYALGNLEAAQTCWRELMAKDAKYHTADGLNDPFPTSPAFYEVAQRIVASLG